MKMARLHLFLHRTVHSVCPGFASLKAAEGCPAGWAQTGPGGRGITVSIDDDQGLLPDHASHSGLTNQHQEYKEAL